MPRDPNEPVRLTRIYTRGGDKGETSLGDGSRVSKLDPRVAAMGDVDELNSLVGWAGGLDRVQNELFDLGADLSVPYAGNEDRLRVTHDAVGQRAADARVVMRGQLVRAAAMPLRGQQDHDGQPAPRDVGVEVAEDAFLLGWNERVDEHGRVVRLVVHTPDLARLMLEAGPVLPVRMRRRPAPQTFGYAAGFHSYLTSGSRSSFANPQVNSTATAP